MKITFDDLVATGPGTLAGRYMRSFWQPVFRSEDLRSGHATPIRIMGEDFTLYRGAGGKPQVVASRCAHRRTRLHTGNVDGDTIQCLYHGWKYDHTGQCVFQPCEREAFTKALHSQTSIMQRIVSFAACAARSRLCGHPSVADWNSRGRHPFGAS